MGETPVGELITRHSAKLREPIPFPGLVPPPSPQPTAEKPQVGIGELPVGELPVGKLASGNPIEAPLANRQRVRRAIRAQDGHSATEQGIYDLLWRYGHPETEDTKILTIGYGRLSEALRKDRTNIRNNVQNLIDKFAIEVVRAGTAKEPTAYRVFSFRKILEARRAHGLEWFQHRGPGVFFVQPLLDLPIGELPIGEYFFGDNSPTGKLPGGECDLPIGETPTPFIEKNGLLEEGNRPAAGAPPKLVQAFREAVGYVDDDLVRRTILKCREIEPTATEEEIAHFIRLTGRMVIRDRSVDNPGAVMPHRVALSFRGESFRQYRQAWAREQALRQQEQESQICEARAVTDNPNSTEMERDWARMVLHELLGE
jgi:hypothetical protein